MTGNINESNSASQELMQPLCSQFLNITHYTLRCKHVKAGSSANRINFCCLPFTMLQYLDLNFVTPVLVSVSAIIGCPEIWKNCCAFALLRSVFSYSQHFYMKTIQFLLQYHMYCLSWYDFFLSMDVFYIHIGNRQAKENDK